ncbi:winged helix-turn-helix domain-containing protein [Serratia entomophila]|uniref:winged helix-turn-helix domain-containing protein n=1 Tax=Serratia entomophila TaxID=42906 RepID=UPI00217796A7|nr:winged helix-turn-helix domain-containing protein [Serratia entomophila]CAI0927011.1 phosphate regulon transcriptional regulatory protein PhoB [Serratia entomophila]CAI1542098.1 phosphate regulon transcriptional regulatory protein PhoB [Serratia entomophila]CAI1663778.1 phosphate regulon transcriptional regulatory protein PhoB [Serratia entomophila]CAI1745130.1 phosphate regulon transcriptional regulatory protein PhoB [Serratia entomophila]CAI1776109.1 phosphate regulon transcriptional regu
MIFIINETILYNEKEGTLAQSDNPATKVALLKPTCRLLSMFIRNNNDLLARDKLLNDVWVEHGLKASNNNLNNYISGLRKSLAQFGGEELLVTYPRQGFKFIAGSIREIADTNELVEDRPASEITEAPATRHRAGRKTTRFYLQRLILFIAACLIPLSAVVLYKNSTRISITPLGQYNKCKIYTMNKGGDGLARIKSMMKNAGFDCRSSANVYYYDKVRDEDKDSTVELITYCPIDTLAPCKNSFFYN